MPGSLKFTISYDGAKRRLVWSMHGFWDMAEVAAFEAALRHAVAPLGPPPLRFDGLSDAREFPVQSREVADALGAIERAGAAIRTGRVAVVVGSLMNKLQAQRSLSVGVRAFLTMNDAEAWLDEREPLPSSST